MRKRERERVWGRKMGSKRKREKREREKGVTLDSHCCCGKVLGELTCVCVECVFYNDT